MAILCNEISACHRNTKLNSCGIVRSLLCACGLCALLVFESIGWMAGERTGLGTDSELALISEDQK